MAEAYLMLDMLYLEDRVRQLEHGRLPKQLRDIQDPMDLSDSEFVELYRINRDITADLVDKLGDRLQRNRISGIEVEKQILAAVRFYATGGFQRPVGDHWGLKMSQSSVSRCIRRVTDAINDLLLRRTVQFPVKSSERRSARELFSNARNPFSGAIGTIDCTQVAILAPSEYEECFVNHYGYHSINVQMICDPNLKILNVNARYPGSRNNADIWKASAAHSIMEMAYNRGERGTYLIGDQSYPLEPWLMTPLPNESEGTPGFLYNEDLFSARNVIDQLFIVLKSTWRCLSKHKVLQYEPGLAGKIVNACSVLHNMRLDHNLPLANENEDEVDVDPKIHIEEQLHDTPNISEARKIQERLIQQRYS